MRCLGRLFMFLIIVVGGVAAYCWFTPVDEYWRARALMKVRQENPAIVFYEKGIRKFPNSHYTPQARYELGMAYFQQKQYEKSAVQLRRALEANPANSMAPEAQYTLGVCLVGLGKTDKAIAEFSKVRKNYAAVGDVVAKAELQLARLYLERHNYTAATRHAQSVIQKYGHSDLAPEAQLLLGDIALEQRRSKTAIAAYEKVCEKYPKSREAVEAQLKIAKIYRDEKNYRDAAKAYKDLLRISGNIGKQLLEDERIRGLIGEAKRFGESLIDQHNQ